MGKKKDLLAEWYRTKSKLGFFEWCKKQGYKPPKVEFNLVFAQKDDK